MSGAVGEFCVGVTKLFIDRDLRNNLYVAKVAITVVEERPRIEIHIHHRHVLVPPNFALVTKVTNNLPQGIAILATFRRLESI